MDDEPTAEDHQRVRILSTLESTRHASRPSRTKGGRRTSKSHRRSWLQGALWGAMGVGVLALMAGFVMVIQDNKPAMAQVLPAPAAPPHALTAASLEANGPAAAGPAVIETTHADAPLAAPDMDATASATPAPATAKPSVAIAAVSSSTVIQPKPGKGATTAKSQDEDVALLEAMFAHTGRKAQPKPAAPKN